MVWNIKKSIIFPPIMSDMPNLLLPSKWRESWVILLLLKCCELRALYLNFLGGELIISMAEYGGAPLKKRHYFHIEIFKLCHYFQIVVLKICHYFHIAVLKKRNYFHFPEQYSSAVEIVTFFLSTTIWK